MNETSRRSRLPAFTAAVAALLLIASPGSADAQKKRKRRKGRAEITRKSAGGPTLRYEQFRRTIEFKVAEKRDEQIEGIKRLLDLGPEEREIPDLKFRLAELYFEKSQFYFFRAQEADDRATNSDSESVRADQLAEKQRNQKESQSWLQTALAVYQEIRDRYPKYERMPEVLFALGQSYWGQSRFEDAIAAYRDLIVGYPDNPLVSEAWIAFGEFYFSEADVNRALKSYERAARDKRSRVYGFALYKQAWCYYNLADWRKALRKFKATVLYSQLSSELSGENKIALGREAQKDWVRTYSHIGKAKRAKFELADLLGVEDCGGTECRKLLEQLAGLWFDEGYFGKSATVYRQLIALAPDDTRTPFFQGRIVDLTSRAGDKKRVIREARRLVELYQATKARVEKLTGNTEADERAREDVRDAAQLAENTLRKLSQLWNREASKTRRPKTYDYARSMYEDYLGLFGRSNYAYEMRFQLGDLYYKLERYDDAAKAYEATVLADVKEPKYLVGAATDNILAVEDYIRDLGVRRPKASEQPVPIHAQKQRLVEACDRYVKLVPADKAEKLVAVKLKAAQVYYDYSHYDEAERRFDEIVRNHPKSEQAEVAANLVIDIHNLRKNWERLYRTASDYAAIPGLTEGRAKLAEDLARFSEYAKFSLVQILEERVRKERGDLRLVATAYEEFTREFPKSENADKALFNASVAFDKAGQKDRADELRKRLLEEYPKSPLGTDVAFYVAKRHAERTEFALAAKAFLEFARRHEDDKRARDALYNAAVFYAGVGKVRTATRLREEYLKKHGRTRGGEKEAADIYWAIAKDLDLAGRYRTAAKRYAEYAKNFSRTDRFWDALWREAEIREKHLGQRRSGEKLKGQLLGTYHYRAKRKRAMPPQAKRYASQVAFERLDDLFSNYARLRVRTPSLRNPRPFQRSLEEKARSRDLVIRKYTRVVTDYQQAESTIASLYRIAEAWRVFVDTLTAVPCPRGVSEDACVLIKGGIEEKAGPARDAAYKAYRACVDKSNELNTFTDYSTACVKALERLAPDDYPQITERYVPYREEPRLRSLESNNLILDFDGYSVAKEAQASAGEVK